MTVLWDVDTQVDFMLPDGKLYVPGAEQTIPAMQRLVDAARAAGVVHVSSADDHANEPVALRSGVRIVRSAEV